jgi:hypothetical protein
VPPAAQRINNREEGPLRRASFVRPLAVDRSCYGQERGAAALNVPHLRLEPSIWAVSTELAPRAMLPQSSTRWSTIHSRVTCSATPSTCSFGARRRELHRRCPGRRAGAREAAADRGARTQAQIWSGPQRLSESAEGPALTPRRRREPVASLRIEERELEPAASSRRVRNGLTSDYFLERSLLP